METVVFTGCARLLPLDRGKRSGELQLSRGAVGRIDRGVDLARADRGVRREEDFFFRRHVIGADAVGLDALDAAAGVHVDAVGAQRRQHDLLAEHVLIRADLGQHLEDGDVAVVLRGDLGAAELQLTQLQLVPFDQTADQLYLYRVRLQPHPRHRL